MLINFSKFNEELKINKMDPNELIEAKESVVERLEEYKNIILDNIKYDNETNKISYKDFKNIDIDDLLKKLKKEFTEDLINDLNVETFFRKIYQILELKKRSTKKLIKDEFVEYFISLDRRVTKIVSGEDKTESRPDEHFDTNDEDEKSLLTKKEYEAEKYDIQVELMKLQEWVMKNRKRVVMIFEGRDAAGKGSTIKRFTEYLNPKGFKVVALGMPTEEEKNNWFARYEKYFPKEGEITFFDRSWYNRAVVEPAMGYCTEEQYTSFIEDVLSWEEKMISSGVILIKFWFSITKERQLSRFEARKRSPLKYWKFSPNDAKVVDKWDIITEYKNQMFNRTASPTSPWVIINSSDKRIGMLNAMRYALWEIDYDDKNDEVCRWYPEVVNIIK